MQIFFGIQLLSHTDDLKIHSYEKVNIYISIKSNQKFLLLPAYIITGHDTQHTMPNLTHEIQHSVVIRAGVKYI